MSSQGCRSRLARREVLSLLAAAGCGLAVVGRPGVGSRAQEGSEGSQASLMTWPGYDRAELYGSYIERHGSPPDISLFSDIEEAHGRLLEGWRGDLIHPCYEAVSDWRAAGYLQAIDTNRLSNWGGIFPRLRELPGTRESWRSWFIPFDWGQTSIVYRTDIVRWTDGVESWSLLWDDRFKGRIGLVDMAHDAWWSAAIYSGVSPYSLGPSDLGEVREALERQSAQAPLIGTPSALEKALAAGDIVAALGWSDSAARLRQQGVPVAFADPVEGALTWCCGLVLHRDAPAADKAHELIDSLISVETGAGVIEAFGFGHANRLAFDQVGDERLASLGLPTRPLATLDRAVLLGRQRPDLLARIEREWAAVSGRQ